jgi:hypothetical protein
MSDKLPACRCLYKKSILKGNDKLAACRTSGKRTTKFDRSQNADFGAEVRTRAAASVAEKIIAQEETWLTVAAASASSCS